MLHAVLNKSWKQHPTKHQQYGHLVTQNQNTLCLKERSSQERNTQNSKFKEENSNRFYSWGLQ